jgi:DNA-binding CsgD family transcriptional regulator
MTTNNTRLNTARSLPLPVTYAAERLNRLQAEIVSAARMLAVDEVGAAMAHQLNEPLTALLLYLHEIREERVHHAGAAAIPDPTRELVENALREARRVCDITERLGHIVAAPAIAETTVARGLEAIDVLTERGHKQGNGDASEVPSRLGQRLTLREREVLALITRGASNKAGGHQLGISKRTFEGHRARIMEKLGAKNAADLGRLAMCEFRDVV